MLMPMGSRDTACVAQCFVRGDDRSSGMKLAPTSIGAQKSVTANTEKPFAYAHTSSFRQPGWPPNGIKGERQALFIAPHARLQLFERVFGHKE